MARPTATTALARHYIRDLVYGANDGIITTFAVVAGVTGGALSHTAILVVGAANLRPTVCRWESATICRFGHTKAHVGRNYCQSKKPVPGHGLAR